MLNDFPFALRRFVDELGDVNVSLFTVQLRCAFIHFGIFSLTPKQIFFKHEWNPDNSLSRSSPSLILVWVKQLVTRCLEIFLVGACGATSDGFSYKVVSIHSDGIVSKMNQSITECLVEF